MRMTVRRTLLTGMFATIVAVGVTVAQPASIWTVVRYPSDESIDARLVTPDSPGGGGKADSIEPEGRIQVLRDGSATTVSVELNGLKRGMYTIYAVEASARVRPLGTFAAPAHKKNYALPATYDTFMIIVSRDANLRSLPERDRIVLYSVAPKNLRVVRR